MILERSASLHTPAAPGAVFLDRDGTLIEEVNYCGDPSRVRLLEGVAPALRRLKALDFRLIIITNQSGIGRGYFTEDDFQKVQGELMRQLDAPGLIDATYHCPDAPDRATFRRKPEPGMILEALEHFGLDAARTYIVGDTCADVVCGQRAKLAGTVLVLTGHGSDHVGKCRPDHVAVDLAAAAVWIAQQASYHG